MATMRLYDFVNGTEVLLPDTPCPQGAETEGERPLWDILRADEAARALIERHERVLSGLDRTS